jgi:hypothetical protein
MLKDVLEYIFETAREDANPKPHMIPTGPLTRMMIMKGQAEDVVLQAPSLQRTAHTLTSVVQLVKTYGDYAAVYVYEKGIEVILDDSDRVETVVMQFELSDQFKALMELKHGVVQKKLVRALRTTLAGCVGREDFLQICRQIEFDVNRASRGEFSNTKESLGRSVEREVRAKAGEMPEEVFVTVPLYSVPHDVNTNITLQCAVMLDIEAETIALEPTGNSLMREKKAVIDAIAAKIKDDLGEDAIVVAGSVATAPIVG